MSIIFRQESVTVDLGTFFFPSTNLQLCPYKIDMPVIHKTGNCMSLDSNQ